MRKNKDKQDRNLRWDIINDKVISTAYRSTYIPAINHYKDIWETYVWKWNGKERGKWLHEYYHNSEKEAIKFHNRLLAIYSYLEQRKYRKY